LFGHFQGGEVILEYSPRLPVRRDMRLISPSGDSLTTYGEPRNMN
jgi:hypothetical protein